MDESTSKKSISYFDSCKTFGAVGANFFKSKFDAPYNIEGHADTW
jgi:hypothetical protein